MKVYLVTLSWQYEGQSVVAVYADETQANRHVAYLESIERHSDDWYRIVDDASIYVAEEVVRESFDSPIPTPVYGYA